MHDFSTQDQFTEQQQRALLDDLEVRCQTNVATIRDASSRRIQARVALLPGNICERNSATTEMQTSELSSSSISGIAPKPLMVGSVFHLQFERSSLDLSPTLAICDRCTMLSDSSFELRFRFTQAIELAPK
jgi:hypothetical protein